MNSQDEEMKWFLHSDSNTSPPMSTDSSYFTFADNTTPLLPKTVAGNSGPTFAGFQNFDTVSPNDMAAITQEQLFLALFNNASTLQEFQCLLDSGAQLDAHCALSEHYAMYGEDTPMILALRLNRLDVFSLFFSHLFPNYLEAMYCRGFMNRCVWHYVKNAEVCDTLYNTLSWSQGIHAVDLQQWTPLHHAVKNGNLPVIKWLLANGANVEARCINIDKQINREFSCTPLHLAILYAYPHSSDIIQTLVSNYCADTQATMLADMPDVVEPASNDLEPTTPIRTLRRDIGLNALQLAIRGRSASIVRLLLTYNSVLIHLNHQTILFKDTAMHLAAKVADADIISALLEHRDKMNMKLTNHLGNTPLECCGASREIIELLMSENTEQAEFDVSEFEQDGDDQDEEEEEVQEDKSKSSNDVLQTLLEQMSSLVNQNTEQARKIQELQKQVLLLAANKK